MFSGKTKAELIKALDIYASAQTSILLKSYEQDLFESEQSIQPVVSPKTQTHIVSRKILIPLVAVIILLIATMVASADIRMKVLEQLRRIYSNNVDYELWSDGDSVEEFALPNINISVPEGFVLNREWGSPVDKHYYYVNPETGDTVSLGYASLDSDSLIGFSMTEEVQRIKIHGFDADLFPHNAKSSQCNIIWTDPDLNLCIVLDTTLDEVSLVKIAESIYR